MLGRALAAELRRTSAGFLAEDSSLDERTAPAIPPSLARALYPLDRDRDRDREVL